MLRGDLEQFDRITFAKKSFGKDGAVDSGHTFVRLRDCFQDCRRLLRGIGIERDHHAAPVPL